MQLGKGQSGYDGTLSGSVLNNSVMVFDYANPETFGGQIGGGGSVVSIGPGLLSLTNTNTYSNGTTISNGTLQLGNGLAGYDGVIAGNVADNSVLAFDYANPETFGGVINGTGQVVVLGGQMLTLTASEGYNGSTTISAGTLQLIGSAALSGGVVNSGGLVFNNNVPVTYGGIMSGSGAISMIGGNYMALTAQSTNSGSVTVSGGTLSLLGGSLYSNLNYGNQVVTVNSGLLVVAGWSQGDTNGANGGLGQLGFGASNLVLNGGTLQYLGSGANLGNTDRGFTIGPGGATLDASGGSVFMLTASGSNGALGVINDASGGGLTLQGSTSGSLGISFTGAGGLVKQGPGTWTVSGSNTYTGTTAVNGGALIALNTFALGSSGGLPAWMSSGNIAVTGAGSTLVLTAGTNAGEFSLATGGGVDQVLSNVNFGANTNLGLLVSDPGDLTYGSNIGNINGPLGFQKSGSGILTLTGTNTYSNGTTVIGGVLVAANTSALGLIGGQPSYMTSNSVTVSGAGSTLVVQAGGTLGEFQQSDVSSLLTNGNFGLGTVFGMRVVSGDSFTYGLTIPDGTSGTAGMGFLKRGGGILTLTAANNYSGTTTLSGGTLVAAAQGALGTGTSIVLGDASTGAGALQLAVNSNGNGYTFGQNVTVNAANVTLAGLSDATDVFNGNILLKNSLTINTAAYVGDGNALTFNGNILNLSGSANSVTVNGSDPSNLTAVVFAGSNNYTGATTVQNNASLTIGASSDLPAATALTINDTSVVNLLNSVQPLASLNGSSSSTLSLGNATGVALTIGSGTFAGAINDSGVSTLTKTTTGTLLIGGPNGIQGQVTVQQGVLLFGSQGSIPTAYPHQVAINAAGAVGINLPDVQDNLLTHVLAGTSNGTVLITSFNTGDAIDLSTSGASLPYVSIGALGTQPFNGSLTPNGTLYRLGGGGGTLIFNPALVDSPAGQTSLAINSTATSGVVVLTNGNNTFSGSTTIYQGTLQVGDGITNVGSLPGAVSDSGALVFATPPSMTLTQTGAISGPGSLAVTSGGTLVVSASNTYTGGTNIGPGSTLQVGNGGPGAAPARAVRWWTTGRWSSTPSAR